MKVLRPAGEDFQFEISAHEKSLLLHLLQLYPLVPASHHRLSKDRQLPKLDENQRLLDESLNAQRLEHRRQIEALLREPDRFVAAGNSECVHFTRVELEWLLQVVNDVRVGSWIALGQPDEQTELRQRRKGPGVRHVVTMDVAGFFEMVFLGAITGEPAPGDE